MNPPRSKFVRARGGRPYFYFRKNGQVIPAGGRGDDQPSTSRNAGSRGRGGVATPVRRNGRNVNLDSSLLHPQFFAAPDDESAVMSYGITVPQPFPGWQLYFHKEVYQPDSELTKRIKLVESCYAKNVNYFDLVEIQRDSCFRLEPKFLNSDEQFMKAWPSFAKDLETRPQRTLAILGLAMYALISAAESAAAAVAEECTATKYVPRVCDLDKIYVRLVQFDNPQKMCGIKHELLDTMYCVRGIVTSMGDVDASASWIAYKCPRCRQEQSIKQKGLHPSQPHSCKREGCLAKKDFAEYRSSPHTRITPKQIVRLMESNIQASDEELFEHIDVELRYDLVNSVICGQEVLIVGILKMRPLVENCGNQQYNTSKPNANAFDIFLKALTVTDAKHVKHKFSDRDLDAIAMINNEPDSFKLLVHSIAPELHGQEMPKAGVLLSLFGGAGSQVDEDDGEINVLLVGDPGIGKSHLLQMCADISQKSSLVSGKRSCTVGNQLAPTIKSRNSLTIDSGALLCSLNGHCCIDDLDRLGTQQDVILQATQSRTVSMQSSNIFGTIKTPTSIIACANSARGHYDQSKQLIENVRIGPTLLNEFHLVYVLFDKPNSEMDTSLTEHINAVHAGFKKSSTIAARFAMKPKTNNSMTMSEIDENECSNNYDLSNRLRLHFNGVEEEQLDLLPPILLKKFITYARQEVRPLLNDDAIADLQKFYIDLRQQHNNGINTINTRHLQALIRLTQARARIDFATEATRLHVRDVLAIVRHSFIDTAVGDFVDLNPATAMVGRNQRGSTKKFIQMLQMANRRIFDMDELKELAKRAGIVAGISELVDAINLQGYLLKKGPNLYEVASE